MGGDAISGTPAGNSGLSPSAPEIVLREAFVRRLNEQGFEGDIDLRVSSRLVSSTDNSIYQRLPAAVIHPRTGEDLNRAVQAASEGDLTLAIRGGGTGTNGQSLTDGVVVDVSRHLDRILDFDAETGTVTVEPGVILARLNAFLKPHGFFFPPTVSTATRATIGGMIATDASGKGSRIYGRTSDYIETLDVVLADGSDLSVGQLTAEKLKEAMNGAGLAAQAYREVHRVVTERADEIRRVFPDMNRGLTGYNLQNVLLEDGSFHLARLLAGSEGTLALTKKVVLRVRRLPKYRQLIVVRYASFNDTLQDVQTLLPANPSAVEVLDDRVLAKAQQDVTWHALERVLGNTSALPVKGMSFVEFVGDNLEILKVQMAHAIMLLESSSHKPIDHKAVSDPEIIANLWTLREKSVGLLGRPDGHRQGVPFVEDTAVPPEVLPEYVSEFRNILDGYGLSYGMFGHADVGCLHVRPFLDMLKAEDRSLIRPISDAVAELTKRHGGLLWGEHGRGFRGEFSPLFFGETLFAELCRIKDVFDPKDIFNRGKLAPGGAGYSVDRIDGIPFKGEFDEEITPALREPYGRSVSCNGNGACFNREPDMAMCPSYKVTKDRSQSPKGRALLLRSWTRLRSLPEDAPDRAMLPVLTEELKASLDTCLSCKACATQCPIRVDIPSMRSKFLSTYFRENRRPVRDYLVYWLEPLLAAGRLAPKLANLLMHSPASQAILSRLGLVDLPHLRPARLKTGSQVSRSWLRRNRGNSRAVIVVQDSFTGSFDGVLVEKIHALLTQLGFDAKLTPVWDNGKARHVLGFRKGFGVTARLTLKKLRALAAFDIPVVSLDAATGLMFTQEYRDIAGAQPIPAVLPLETFLRQQIVKGTLQPVSASSENSGMTVISHCTEQAARPESAGDWAFILRHFGVPADAGKAGCCGMAGLFGHQTEHAKMSRDMFEQNWARKVEMPVLATGFSCRCQTERMAGIRPSHPAETLISVLQERL
ncbi:FAD-binding and (Fe-S)-binding domain-containing protein [Gluconobacter albidus]|uniref:D-2-hydroxyglutarate dehydrogenase n=1 Tax=Gluconobacter albidus TaxID=318683 RepID=A0AAW3QV34_9PROT|nr:FAD-binding and (Fe-S)-binding domain-containing protein [Gluconobacter albidus]KXV37242.1 oxidoreductase [Gluconobacter albidus]GBQ88923.1 oxidoreductase [Gluconobacter albidus NBRC 3250]GLQ69126.1 membrane protein [Gluconobacter albidus]